MQNLLRITVAPHVGSYLRLHFGERINLSDKNCISNILIPLLEPFEKLDPFLIKTQRKESLGDWLEVYINDSMLRRYGGHLSNESIDRFNESVDLLIKQEMYRWCHHPNAEFKEVDYNIRRFMEFYGFYDLLTFDNLKRWFYRERKRILNRRTQKEIETRLTISIQKTYYSTCTKSTIQLSFF